MYNHAADVACMLHAHRNVVDVHAVWCVVHTVPNVSERGILLKRHNLTRWLVAEGSISRWSSELDARWLRRRAPTGNYCRYKHVPPSRDVAEPILFLFCPVYAWPSHDAWGSTVHAQHALHAVRPVYPGLFARRNLRQFLLRCSQYCQWRKHAPCTHAPCFSGSSYAMHQRVTPCPCSIVCLSRTPGCHSFVTNRNECEKPARCFERH